MYSQSDVRDVTVAVPAELVIRLCNAFIEMENQGATPSDETVFQELEQVIADQDSPQQ
jgi:hypothetical protein